MRVPGGVTTGAQKAGDFPSSLIASDYCTGKKLVIMKRWLDKRRTHCLCSWVACSGPLAGTCSAVDRMVDDPRARVLVPFFLWRIFWMGRDQDCVDESPAQAPNWPWCGVGCSSRPRRRPHHGTLEAGLRTTGELPVSRMRALDWSWSSIASSRSAIPFRGWKRSGSRRRSSAVPLLVSTRPPPDSRFRRQVVRIHGNDVEVRGRGGTCSGPAC